jgi:GNAT superfamily N-acetyltransferase
MTITLRTATAADCDGIVDIFLACWRESYAPVLPSHVVQSMTDERARALWASAFANRARTDEIMVAAGGGPRGLCGVVRYELDATGQGVIWSLYVDPASQGSGLGTRLLQQAETALAERGAKTASLSVFSGNTPSLAFYARHGWQPGSETEESRLEFGEPVLKMAKFLPGSEPGWGAPYPASVTSFEGDISL